MTTAEEEAILACVSNTPESATTIYRRVAGHGRKNLTAKRRRERRRVAAALHEMALRGVIERGEGDRELYPIPVYSLK